jgi:DNA-directed RNA polymerase specialized sigma24 family protein
VKSEQEQLAIFGQRFLRSYRLLDFIACRILGNQSTATIAIQNCWKSASRKPPHFEYEGAFRSWLVRVLIDEALAILRESHRAKDAAISAVNFFPLPDRTVKPGCRRAGWEFSQDRSSNSCYRT